MGDFLKFYLYLRRQAGLAIFWPTSPSTVSLKKTEVCLSYTYSQTKDHCLNTAAYYILMKEGFAATVVSVVCPARDYPSICSDSSFVLKNQNSYNLDTKN